MRLSRLGFPGHLTLQQRLDRLVSGLGTDLLSAVGGKATKKSTAVLAAFALYGVRASEWLDEDPKRVVLDLQQQLQQSEARRRGRRTRTDQRKTDQRTTDQRTTDQRTPDEPWGSRAAALSTVRLLLMPVPEESATGNPFRSNSPVAPAPGSPPREG